MPGARAWSSGSVLSALFLIGCAGRPPVAPAPAPTRPLPAPREIVDRHGHTLAHLPPAPGDGACAPDVVAAAGRALPGRGPIVTWIDGGLQALGQAVLQERLERLARTRQPPDPAAGPPRPGQARVGTVLRVVAEGLLVELGVGAPALLALPPPVACAGHVAALLPPPAARFRTGDRLLVRVAEAATAEAPARLRLGLQGALVALDPQGRDVLALVGGYAQSPGEESRALQRPRPAGAAIHPLIYAAALATGRWTARSQVDTGAFGRNSNGRLGLREALAQSSTPAAVRLLADVGVDPVLQLAGRLGIPVVQLPRDLSLPQRARLTPWQLAAASATLADSRAGRHAAPRLLREDGEGAADGDGAIPPAAAYQLGRLLHGAIEAGSATAAQDLGVPDLAGKTGTGEGGRDAWFVGYHADLLCVVWVGEEDPGGLTQLSGAASALPIWIDFMSGAAALLGRQPPSLPRPPGAPPDLD